MSFPRIKLGTLPPPFPSDVQVRTLSHEGTLWVSFSDLAAAAAERTRNIERQLMALKVTPQVICADREKESKRPGMVNLKYIPMGTVKALGLTPRPPMPPPVAFYPVAPPSAPIAPHRPSLEAPSTATPVPCGRCATLEAENKRLRAALVDIEGFARSVLAV